MSALLLVENQKIEIIDTKIKLKYIASYAFKKRFIKMFNALEVLKVVF